MIPSDIFGAQLIGGNGPSEEQQRMFLEQQRIAMIENYRQSVAMHAMIPMCVRLELDCTETELVSVAKKAKRAADALCRELFGEESQS